MNFDTLKTQSPEQLRELAGKMGLQVHWKAKPETVIKQIMDATFNKQNPVQEQELKHVAQNGQAPVDHNTPDDIEKALASLKAKVPQFETTYDLEDNTVHFSCKGAVECHNMDIPLRVLVKRAGLVSHGRIAPRALNQEFGNIQTPGNSTYTNTVLT